MKKIRSINIEADIWNILDKIANKEKRSKSNMIEYLVLNYVKQEELKNDKHSNNSR